MKNAPHEIKEEERSHPLPRRIYYVGDEMTADQRPCDCFELLACQLDVDWTEDRILANCTAKGRGVLNVKMDVRVIRVSRQDDAQ